MVLIEIIRVCTSNFSTWKLLKFAEQFARLLWVGFLANSYTHLQGFRVGLFVLCIYAANSESMLTIGRVFEFSSEDEVFTRENPYWRATCLSFALAKMLRSRFAKLPVDEAGCRKALNFVLEGLIDYIGTNQDIQTDVNSGEIRYPMNWVFSIIQKELNFVSDFLHRKVPISHYFKGFVIFDWISNIIMVGNVVYLLSIFFKKGSAWHSHAAHEEYKHCIS